jgi:hypothetical protein
VFEFNIFKLSTTENLPPVRRIIIDHKIIIPYQHNSFYDIGSLDGKNRIINNFSSNLEETRDELISMGVDSSRIVAVPVEMTYINRTLKSALAFRNWLKASKYTVKGAGPSVKCLEFRVPSSVFSCFIKKIINRKT